MADAISALTGGLTSGWAANATAPTADSQQLGKDAFLTLLVAQLKYQDPSKPADASQFLAQTAQFTLVEKFEEVQSQNLELLATSQRQAAIALVGKAVSWTDEAGQARTGTVAAVSMTGGKAALEIGGVPVELDAVTRVEPASTP